LNIATHVNDYGSWPGPVQRQRQRSCGDKCVPKRSLGTRGERGAGRFQVQPTTAGRLWERAAGSIVGRAEARPSDW
jgi:hypothetical protein